MPDLLPLFPLELVLLPATRLPLHIFEPHYKEMIGICLRDKSPFGIVRAAEDDEERADWETVDGRRITDWGCTAEVTAVPRTYPDGRMDIVVTGRRRFEVLALDEEREYLQANVAFFDDEDSRPASRDERGSALALHEEVVRLAGAEETEVELESAYLSFQLAAALPVDLDFKLAFLKMRSESDRIRILLAYYTQALPKLKMLAFGRQKTRGNGWVH